MYIIIPQLIGTVASLAEDAVMMVVDANTYTLLGDIDFPTDHTYLRITDDAHTEEVKVVNRENGYLVIERGASGTIPQNFTNAVITSHIGYDAIIDLINQTPQSVDLTIDGTGLVDVDRVGNTVTINVPIPQLQTLGSLEGEFNYPDLVLGVDPNAGCCSEDEGGGSGEGGIDSVNASGVVDAQIDGTVLSINVDLISLSGGTNIEVTGSWPNYVISYTGSTGGGTTVAVGAGLTLTGDPSVNPTISISNTGVTPGDYAGLVINAQGQITEIPAGFNPVSEITSVDSTVTIDRTDGTVDLSVDAAEIGVAGIAPLADPAEPLDDEDESSIVTPALLAAVLATQGVVSELHAGSATAEVDAEYTNILTSTNLAINIPAGKKAILIGWVNVVTDATPTDPTNYGLAIFEVGGVKVVGNKKITQNQQLLVWVVEGEINTTVALVTTAISGASVQGQYLAAIII